MKTELNVALAARRTLWAFGLTVALVIGAALAIIFLSALPILTMLVLGSFLPAAAAIAIGLCVLWPEWVAVKWFFRKVQREKNA